MTGSTIGWYPVVALALVVAGFIIARIAYRHRREVASRSE
jgi:dolichyl-phosphate-mannose--protein O-mannosyl transferase